MSTTKTAIEWTDRTWNPIRGCSRVSEGCRHCYAERQAARFAGPGRPFDGFVRIQAGVGPQWTGKVELVESHLLDPLKWRSPSKVFVNSMSDLFHESLPDEAIDRVFAVMVLADQHTYQILTKRADRLLKWTESFKGDRAESRGQNCAAWMMSVGFTGEQIEKVAASKFWRGQPHIWLGVSVEDQKTADERIPLLLQTPAAIRFVSYEPALGPVDFDRFDMTASCEWRQALDWIIVGGESGPGARPFDVGWARNTVRQTRFASACFVKQVGAVPYGETLDDVDDWAKFDGMYVDQKLKGFAIELSDRKGGDMNEWPKDLRVREFPGEVARD